MREINPDERSKSLGRIEHLRTQMDACLFQLHTIIVMRLVHSPLRIGPKLDGHETRKIVASKYIQSNWPFIINAVNFLSFMNEKVQTETN